MKKVLLQGFLVYVRSTDVQKKELQERIADELGSRPTDEWHREVLCLAQIIRGKLENGWKKEDENTAMDLLRKIKAEWMDKNVVVVCTTISQSR